MANVITTFENAEDGIASMVIEGDKGYNVVLRDTDADENLGVVIIYPSNMLEQAISKAKNII